jgi:heme-degrading monooxygenase HmoA
MPKLVELDRHVSLFKQMEEQHVGSVFPINTFTVEPEEADQLQEAWASDAAFMNQPSFISTQLHRGIGRSSVFVNYAVWASVEHFKRAFTNPEFQAKMQE